MLFTFTKKILCHVYEHIHVHAMFYKQLTSIVLILNILFVKCLRKKQFIHMNPNYALERIVLEFYSNLNNATTGLDLLNCIVFI